MPEKLRISKMRRRLPPFFSNYPPSYLYIPGWGRNYQSLAELVQKANVTRSVGITATPIASVAALNTLVQGVIDTNAFSCMYQVIAVTTIVCITRMTPSFGVNVVYENPATTKKHGYRDPKGIHPLQVMVAAATALVINAARAA